MSGAHRFDNKDIWHDRQDVVVRREGGEPVNGKIVDPHDEDGDVDGEDPEHEDEQGVRVVVEVIIGAGPLQKGQRIGTTRTETRDRQTVS